MIPTFRLPRLPDTNFTWRRFIIFVAILLILALGIYGALILGDPDEGEESSITPTVTPSPTPTPTEEPTPTPMIIFRTVPITNAPQAGRSAETQNPQPVPQQTTINNNQVQPQPTPVPTQATQPTQPTPVPTQPSQPTPVLCLLGICL